MIEPLLKSGCSLAFRPDPKAVRLFNESGVVVGWPEAQLLGPFLESVDSFRAFTDLAASLFGFKTSEPEPPGEWKGWVVIKFEQGG